jgi:hypothetical protein
MKVINILALRIAKLVIHKSESNGIICIIKNLQTNIGLQGQGPLIQELSILAD